MIVVGIREAHVVVAIVGEGSERTAGHTLSAADEEETQEALIAPTLRIDDEGIAAEIADSLGRMIGIVIVTVIVIVTGIGIEEEADVEEAPAAGAHVVVVTHVTEIGDAAAATIVANLTRTQRYM